MAKYEVQFSGYDGGWQPVDATDDPYEAVLMARNDAIEHERDVRIVHFQNSASLCDYNAKCVYYADWAISSISYSAATQDERARYGAYLIDGDRVIIDGELMTNSFRQSVQNALTEIHMEGL